MKIEDSGIIEINESDSCFIGITIGFNAKSSENVPPTIDPYLVEKSGGVQVSEMYIKGR